MTENCDEDPYATLGVGYSAHRRAEPRWQALVDQALDGAGSVVNVGAGTGSYEPATTVLAVEPSATMIEQRRAACAPVVQAPAEAIPLSDGAVDAALAVLTVHHWSDPAAGLAEMVRVADRQVVLTWDPAYLARTFWLITDYLPEIADHEADLACHDRIVSELNAHGRRTRVVDVPVPADCRDGVLAAHWARPYAYLERGTHAAASGLARLPAHVLHTALVRLRDDLTSGRWHRRHGGLLAHGELDLGYRLVVADGPTRETLMFTGIVQHLGTITDVAGTKLSVRIDGALATSLEVGESVAVNGVDLTVAEHDGTTFRADVMPETLRRTALGRLAPGARVNLERAVRPLDRMSGHVVQGVVEGTALLRENAADDAARVLRFEAADHLIDHMLVKGPVALDGVSLTLVEVTRTTFAVSLVVHTQAHTTLVGLPAGALVNVETDVLGRYVAHHLGEAGARARPTTASTREGDRR